MNFIQNCLSRHSSEKFSATLEEIFEKYKVLYNEIDDSIIETRSGRKVFVGKPHDFEVETNPSYSFHEDVDLSSESDDAKGEQWDNVSLLSYSHLNGIANVCGAINKQKHMTESTRLSDLSEESNHSCESENDDDFWKLPLKSFSMAHSVQTNVSKHSDFLRKDILEDSFDVNEDHGKYKMSAAKNETVGISQHPRNRLLDFDEDETTVQQDEDRHTDSFSSNEENSLSLRSHLHPVPAVSSTNQPFSPTNHLSSPFKRVTLGPVHTEDNILAASPECNSTISNRHSSMSLDGSYCKRHESRTNNHVSNREKDIVTIRPKTKSNCEFDKSSNIRNSGQTKLVKSSTTPECRSAPKVFNGVITKSSSKKHVRKIFHENCSHNQSENLAIKPKHKKIPVDILCSSDEENSNDFNCKTPKRHFRPQKTVSSTMKLRSGKAKTNIFHC